ncbi:MAG TPA: hypothetical protein VM054_04965 [bacterium]|nr:hypothetical protein [bacterium]
MDEKEKDPATDVGQAVGAGVKAMRKGLAAGMRGMRTGLREMHRGMDEGRKHRCGPDNEHHGHRAEEAGMDDEQRNGWWFNFTEGVNISLDLSGLLFGFLSLGLGVGAFFLYLIPFVLVLSWPFAIAGLIVGLVAVFNFRAGWFRGFLPGLVGLGLSGAVLWFHIMNLIWTTGTLDYMLGLWGPPPGL